MKYITTAVGMMLLMSAAVAAVGQSSTPKPAPELKQVDVWVGDWALSGTAKDSPAGPEYKVDWHMHNHWILGGSFLETDSTWKGNGAEVQFLEIGNNAVSGFASDGRTWVLTATWDKETTIENMTITSPDGKLSTCRNTWHFSPDRMAVSGTEECEEKGVHWAAFKVKGTKSKTAQ